LRAFRYCITELALSYSFMLIECLKWSLITAASSPMWQLNDW
jgi:hypothetical protein